METTPRSEPNASRHAGGWVLLGGLILLVGLRSATERKRRDRPAAQDAQADSMHRTVGFPILTIDINQATEAELSCVEGIGPQLAARIVEYRRRVGAFSSLEQLDDIPGVGPRLVAQLRIAIAPLPSVGSPSEN